MAFRHHEDHHPDDDIEAIAADHSNSGLDGTALDGPPSDKDLGEYEALDRFITGYDASGQQRGEEEALMEAERVPWWKFWKSSSSQDTSIPADQQGKPPAAWLETDIRQGISSSEVAERRRRFGWNELTAEKENQFRKFLSFFQGPILYGQSSRDIHENLVPKFGGDVLI